MSSAAGSAAPCCAAGSRWEARPYASSCAPSASRLACASRSVSMRAWLGLGLGLELG